MKLEHLTELSLVYSEWSHESLAEESRCGGFPSWLTRFQNSMCFPDSVLQSERQSKVDCRDPRKEKRFPGSSLQIEQRSLEYC